MDNELILKIDAILPQTQCTRCGYPSCRDYAKAIAEGNAEINQCPPGGDAGIVKLANLLHKPVLPLNPANGKIKPRQLALIDEDVCIGCTLCIKVCPVDAIIGGNKMIHTVIADECTGCDLCVPVCPVDCIDMYDDPDQNWLDERRQKAQKRFEMHNARRKRDQREREERLAKQAELLKKVRPNEKTDYVEQNSAQSNSKLDFIAQIMAKAKPK